MKPPVPAPFYACLYPGLCEVARANGYALTIHGSMTRDLDLVAIPWTAEAVDAEALVLALKTHVGAMVIPGFLDDPQAFDWTKDPTEKPHGRLAWNLYFHLGCQIDLSVMPRIVPSRPAVA